MSDVPGSQLTLIGIEYDARRVSGRLTLSEGSSSIWDRIKLKVLPSVDAQQVSASELEVPWPIVLDILREFGTREQQAALHFRFKPLGQAGALIAQFAKESAEARAARSSLTLDVQPHEIQGKLAEFGFERVLRDFQCRDLARLMALPHGANFSVPGAGKTTVTFALHLLTRPSGGHLFVVGPKAAFSAWSAVIEECMPSPRRPEYGEPFTLLDGSTDENAAELRSGATRFLMSYDLMVRQQSVLANYFARNKVHIVLDEAHRMKAGNDSRRGAFLLNVSTLFARRDILTGTPMPQGPRDLASQLNFLWPGQGHSSRLQRGEQPRAVLGNLYVRTTKSELGLDKPRREYLDVDMSQAQLALYGVVRSETLRQLHKAIAKGRTSPDFLGARRSVMRLLQLSSHPVLALRGISEDYRGVDSGLFEAVLQDGLSTKLAAVIQHARKLARGNRKVVIWSIFTEVIETLERQLADLGAVSLHGSVPTGDDDDVTFREGRLKKFHEDSACHVLVANPAAAGEGISLHTVCHDAIYLDRSYVSTHYLQSIDRIHRLGLKPGTETNIYIYRTRAPAQLGSIDFSVGRRLASKIRSLQQLLDDKDLHELALDEEDAADPNDYSVDLQDLVDLVEELEGRSRARSEVE